MKNAPMREVNDVYARVKDLEEQKKVAAKGGKAFAQEAELRRLHLVQTQLNQLSKIVRSAPSSERLAAVRQRMKALAAAGLRR